MWIFTLTASLALAGPYEDGVAALKAGRAEQAATLFEQVVEDEPGHAQAWWELGWARWSSSDFERAAECWARVETLNPEQQDLGYWLSAAKTRAALASGPRGKPVGEPSAPGPASLRVMAAGDTMMGSDLRKGASGLAPDDGQALFVGVQDVLQQADVAFLNLEGPLADGLPSTKCRPNSTSCYAFRTPTKYAERLAEAGIDVVSLANNHAMDLGVAGQEATMKALDAVGIAHAGRYGDVARLERKGQVVAVVAAHSGSCCLNVNRPDEIARAVELADEWADIVVLSFHGGAEGYQARHVPGKVEVAWGEQRGDVKALAHAAIDAGADLVLGHGPHVLRGMERYKGRLIAYSLGNFMGFRQFGTQGGHGGTSVVLDVELDAQGQLVGGRVHAMALDGEGVPHPDADRRAIGSLNELSAADFAETAIRVTPEGALTW